jgi:hypothetical protein
MKVTLDFEIKNCKDCPFLTTGRTYGKTMVEMVI